MCIQLKNVKPDQKSVLAYFDNLLKMELEK